MDSFSTSSISVRCPVFIGRVAEYAALTQLVDRTRSGEGHVALVGGEAGVGKSRLVAEAKAYAAAHDLLLLLEGHCFQTDSAFPYAPLLDLFRSYFARFSSLRLADDNTHSFAATIIRLLPDLALLFPDLAALPLSLPIDAEEEKRRLFAAMTHFLTEQATRHPVLLIVEDVHWCDDLSLDFLLHLARHCRTVPLLLLVTYRSDETHPRLRRWLTQLDRERLAEEIALRRLTRNDVAAMLHAMLEMTEEGDGDFFERLYTHSEGNPFFVEELLKSLMTTGGLVAVDGAWQYATRQVAVPRSVQEAVQQRAVYLSADARRLLTLAAIAGRRFNITLLQAVMRCDEEHLLTLLKELMAAQLVVEEAADQFTFRHALTQEAISAELLVRERQSLHRTIAETLEQLATTDFLRERFLGDLALHCYEATMWQQAITYAKQAGGEALALYAHQAAIDQLTRAIGAAQHLSQTPVAEIYQMRGQAYERLGDFEHARKDYEWALAAARATQHRLMEWQSMLALSFLWTGHDYEKAEVWLHQALALAEELNDATLHAQSLNRLGNWLLNRGQFPEAIAAHQEALRLCEAQSDQQGMAEALEMLGGATFFMGDPASGVQNYFGRVIDLCRSLDDQQRLSSTLAARAMDVAAETIETTYSALRTCDECVQDAEEALLLARQTNSLSGQAFAELAYTMALTSFGEFGSAFVHAYEALQIATSIEHQEWSAAINGALGQIYLLLLEPEKAISYLEMALAGAQASGSMIWTGYLTPYLAQGYLSKQEYARAEATLKTIILRDQLPGNFFERQTMRVWGQFALAQGEPAIALAIAEQLLLSASGGWQQPIPHLLALKGEALLALKRLEAAAVALEQARLGAEQRQAPSVLWRIQRSLGQAYHHLKREEQAQYAWSEAREIIARLAMTIEDTPLREHFLQSALASFPKERLPSPQETTSKRYGGLSTRERQVAVLVAEGKSNREIAALLVVSERTAEAHVSNILGKLGYATRAQIAAWVVDKGLHTPL